MDLTKRKNELSDLLDSKKPIIIGLLKGSLTPFALKTSNRYMKSYASSSTGSFDPEHTAYLASKIISSSCVFGACLTDLALRYLCNHSSITLFRQYFKNYRSAPLPIAMIALSNGIDYITETIYQNKFNEIIK